MSMPKIPDMKPDVDISREQTINLLLVSIAMEELGIAHILNAEGEKIQSLLGTLPGQCVKNPSIDDLLQLNQSVEKTLRNLIKKEMLLQFKFENILELDFKTPEPVMPPDDDEDDEG